MPLLLLLHAAATLFMTGLIWFVQVVHYPLFAAADRTGFANFQHRHTARTTRVVAPVMVLEAVTAVGLAVRPPAGVPAWGVIAGLILLATVWLSTAFLQIPCHRSLARGFDTDAHRALVRTNWARTVAWSLRAILVGYLLWRVP